LTLDGPGTANDQIADGLVIDLDGTGPGTALGFSINVSGANLVADSDVTITALLRTAADYGVYTPQATDSQTYIVDIVPPAAPSTPDLTAGSDSGTSSTDNITNDDTPTFTGTGENGATVTLFEDLNSNGTVDTGESRGTGTVANGTWTITSSTLADGNHMFKAIQTDVAGNTSSASSALTVTIDTSAPAAPSTPDMDAGSDSGSSNTDNITNDDTPTFTGTGENGATVTLFEDLNSNGTVDTGESRGTGTVANGTWTITSSSLADGDHMFKAIQTDVAGNTSTASSALTVTIDTSAAAPSTPDLDAGSDSGSSNTDNITNDDTPTFTGTGENGATVTLFEDLNSNGTVDTGESRGTGTVANGTWTITSSSLADGDHMFKAIQTDVAGNTSTASAALTVTIDTTTPSVLAVAVPPSGNYGTNQNLDFNVEFSELVVVDTDGGTSRPFIEITIGSNNRQAFFHSAGVNNMYLFRYTVVAGDAAAAGQVTVGTVISLNGGTIRDVAGNNANLTLNNVGSTANITVNN
jgi:hypothetical protein